MYACVCGEEMSVLTPRVLKVCMCVCGGEGVSVLRASCLETSTSANSQTPKHIRMELTFERTARRTPRTRQDVRVRLLSLPGMLVHLAHTCHRRPARQQWQHISSSHEGCASEQNACAGSRRLFWYY